MMGQMAAGLLGEVPTSLDPSSRSSTPKIQGLFPLAITCVFFSSAVETSCHLAGTLSTSCHLLLLRFASFFFPQ